MDTDVHQILVNEVFLESFEEMSSNSSQPFIKGWTALGSVVIGHLAITHTVIMTGEDAHILQVNIVTVSL